MSADTMKAQRGRRGLISYGEVMPSKLTKGQKKLAKKKNDISSILAAHKVDAALTTPATVGSVQWGKLDSLCSFPGQTQDPDPPGLREGRRGRAARSGRSQVRVL